MIHKRFLFKTNYTNYARVLAANILRSKIDTELSKVVEAIV